MRLTILGGAGAWPPAGGACSGYLVEEAGFRLLIDPGYAVLPRLLELLGADAVDAVLVSHGHPDHVADLNPLLRARALRDVPAPPLPTFALPGALRAVLALDRPGMLDDALDLHEFDAGEAFRIGPVALDSRLLPHYLPNAGLRLTAGGRSITYTGDAGPSDALVELAQGTDLLLAEATYAERVPDDSAAYLNSALEVGRQAARAEVDRLVLTHLQPGTDPVAARDAARRAFDRGIEVAEPGLTVELS
ncbi:MAG TPA: MBL fold metallo-hydrolase [Candidatus Limnocylindrales bacterium]